MTRRVYEGCLLFIIIKIQWDNLVVWVKSLNWCLIHIQKYQINCLMRRKYFVIQMSWVVANECPHLLLFKLPVSAWIGLNGFPILVRLSKQRHGTEKGKPIKVVVICELLLLCASLRRNNYYLSNLIVYIIGCN